MKWLPVFLICIPLAASAADQGRVSYLEQEVRDLHRQLDALARQVELMRTRPALPSRPGGAALPAPKDSPADPAAWIDAAKWKRLRTGMSELEVIESLGAPTSMREEQGARVLFYALEVGSSGFLGGSVVLRDRAVVEVRPPVLQ
jgi:hypothetical protein